MKTKKCKVCGTEFNLYRSTQQVCGPKCAIELTNRQKSSKAQQQRKADRLKVEALRPLSWYKSKAQTAFNNFVRYRDKDEPCISCQRHHQGQNHAGHFMTRGARPELSYHPSNNNLQCAPCNLHLSGNLILYRQNLINKVGNEMVDYLENFNSPQKWTIEDLKEITQHYKDELKRLKSE